MGETVKVNKRASVAPDEKSFINKRVESNAFGYTAQIKDAPKPSSVEFLSKTKRLNKTITRRKNTAKIAI